MKPSRQVHAVGLATIFVASAFAMAEPLPSSVIFSEFEVELPAALRMLAGHGTLSPIACARVTIAAPLTRDASHGPHVLIVNATSDRGYNSSRRLLRRYAETSVAEGWIVVAADAVEDVADFEDDVALRLALDTAALAVLQRQRPEAADAPLAFAGFSGGAKISGWLAAGFAKQGRTVIGVYQAGINEDTIVAAATQFDVVDPTYRRVPIVLVSGRDDEVATPSDHRDVAARLKRGGFANVRIATFAGEHEVEPQSLRTALAWFDEIASSRGTGR